MRPWHASCLAALAASAGALPQPDAARPREPPPLLRRDTCLDASRRPAPCRFSRAATQRFAVNGSAIPEVDFDVGESYAGLLPVSQDPDEQGQLYFWFFPTGNEEHRQEREIVIWLNGGPGCSSLAGLLQQNGPFLWQPGTLAPLKNPWSWHRLTNVVWIDQPVGVGFSQGRSGFTTEDALAEQFLGFWENFVDTFGMHGWRVYIAAESYGGFYGPYIGSHMLDSADRSHHNFQGLIVYDGYISERTTLIQRNVPLASFIEQHHDVMPLRDSSRAQIHAQSARCGFTDWHYNHLRYPPDGPAPQDAPSAKTSANGSDRDCFFLFWKILRQAILLNPCFDNYNILRPCPLPHDSLDKTAPYFNRADVKRAINAPVGTAWIECVETAFNTSDGWGTSPSPDRYQLPRVIEATQNVILAHGAMDFSLPLNGLLLAIQNMTWGGKQGFQEPPRDPFYVPHYNLSFQSRASYYQGMRGGAGVLGTTHTERGLTLAVTRLAGHHGPGDAPTASFRHMEKLLGRIQSLSEKTPFTLPELKHIPQLDEPLGQGTVFIPCFGRGC